MFDNNNLNIKLFLVEFSHEQLNNFATYSSCLKQVLGSVFVNIKALIKNWGPKMFTWAQFVKRWLSITQD